MNVLMLARRNPLTHNGEAIFEGFPRCGLFADAFASRGFNPSYNPDVHSGERPGAVKLKLTSAPVDRKLTSYMVAIWRPDRVAYSDVETCIRSYLHRGPIARKSNLERPIL